MQEVLVVFHLDISGKFIKDEHPENIQLISFTILVNDADKLNKDINSFKYN